MRLAARGIDKSFPGVRALRDVDLAVAAGEVLAVVGENGAGKSTLMKILAGVDQPDRGEILVDGEAQRFRNVQAALSAGVALIHQELCLCDRLSVAANVCLGRESSHGAWMDHRAIDRRAREALGQVGLSVDPATPLSDLAIGQRQLVEIAKALDCEAQVLIMDEPTSSLSLAEAERLHSLVEQLAEQGTTILYISHRLAEIERLASSALVLRDGEVTALLEAGEIRHEVLVRHMVGRDLTQLFPDRPDRREGVSSTEPPALEVFGLRTQAHPEHTLDLRLEAGEIVGVAGLVGAGRSEVLRALVGIDSPVDGVVRVAGAELDPSGSGATARAIEAGIVLVPEDRKEEGLFLTESVKRNLSITSLRRQSRAGFVDSAAEREVSAQSIAQMGIKTASELDAVGSLSGGNQQKVVLGRSFATRPVVLCLDEPTRGVDVGAKSEIYRLLRNLAGEGLAVLFVSSEMEEVIGLADRCWVLHEGRLAGELAEDELREETILMLATGAGLKAGEAA